MRRLADVFRECEWVFVGQGPFDPAGWGLPNVRCPGVVGHPELGAYYQAADLLVLPSVIEGFPLVVQEAMASGTPVLVTKEIVKGCPAVGGVAHNCDPDEEQFASCLQELIASAPVLESQRGKVASFAHKHWYWEGCAERYLELFNNILGYHHMALVKKSATLTRQQASLGRQRANAGSKNSKDTKPRPERRSKNWPNGNSPPCLKIPHSYREFTSGVVSQIYCHEP
ncbi:MAG: glycosyltransferase [Planctomycetes bacterium]|nr:glycosyltransferase [Planctomycetota bacterium]